MTMRVIERAVYRGPNIFGLPPMIRIRLDLGPLLEWPSHRIEGFADALLALLPGLAAHGCSYRVPGGFVRRLRAGTWIGHVAEHVALELQSLAGHAVARGKTRGVRGAPGVFDIVYAYVDAPTGLLAGRFALELVDQLVPAALRGVSRLDALAPGLAGPFALTEALAALRSAVDRARLGPSTTALWAAARRRGIPVERIERSLIRLGWGAAQLRLRAAMSDRTSVVAVGIAADKEATRQLLRAGGVPAPRGGVVADAAAAIAAVDILGTVVVKPRDGNHGRGVTVAPVGEEAIAQAFAAARRAGREVVVEERLPGHDYRLLVVGGRVVAVAERHRAHVVGDGQATIAALIAAINADPRRGGGHRAMMTRIRIDARLRTLLAAGGRSLATIPAAGETVVLADTANLSTGGTATDCTDSVHPDNAAIARRAAAIVGLDIAGVDLIAPDIAQSLRTSGGGVIEVNASPGLRMHLAPARGRARDVAQPIVAHLFGRRQRGRIPLVAITGTNGKSSTARMVAHILALGGARVGLATSGGVFVDGVLVHAGDATGPRSARTVLADPLVDIAVLETARGGILREGLGFDRADVGCVTNIAADHLGQRGLETLGDLARVKSLVVRVVHRRGLSVLNADDPLARRIARRAGGRVAWFSLDGGDAMAPALMRHIDGGGMALVREPGGDGGLLVLHDRGIRTPLLAAAAIPATLEGQADFNIANAAAAALIALGLGQPAAFVARALSTFAASFALNPGRLNVVDRGGVRVILDYAHNPAGIAALAQLVGRLRPRHSRALGLLCIPGDRRDDDIRAVGAIGARHFDRLFFREEPGRRGRPPGEIVRLLCEGTATAGFDPAAISVGADEPAAITAALAEARAGDLLVMTVTRIEASWHQVTGNQLECRNAAPGAAEGGALWD